MTIYYKIFLTSLCLMLSACLATNPHSKCIEDEPYQAAIPYCCEFSDGYCHRTCYNYETRYRCLEAECDEGYVWEAVDNPKWWQNKEECVPDQTAKN
jgi:hypothetical protein